MFEQQPYKVTYEFSRFDAHDPYAAPQWGTECVTIWANSYAEVRRICRTRYGVIPVTIQPLWVSPDVGEC